MSRPSMVPAPPGPEVAPWFRWLPYPWRNRLGHLPGFARDPLAQLLQAAIEFGDLVCFNPGRIYLAAAPELIQHVLQDRHTNYGKGHHYAFMKPALGQGLVTSEGAFWQRQRRLAQPAFQRKLHRNLAAVMVDCTLRMLERWAPRAQHGQSFDLHAELIQLTLEILLRSMFTVDIQHGIDELSRAVLDIEHYLNPLHSFVPRLPAALSGSRREFEAAKRAIDAFVFRVVVERRRRGAPTDDLLGLLLGARDPQTGESMSDPQLRDELVTMMLAGHDTVSNALTWTWMLLSDHPQVRERVEAEVDQVLGDRQPSFDDLPRLEYCLWTIQEGMRLFPPIWVIGRTAIGEDQIGGYPIPAGALLVLSPYVTHRLPTLWPDPDVFDPQRFAPSLVEARHRFAYFPFAGGPRLCIGREYALMETALILAAACRSFRLELVPNQRIRPKPRLSLLPDRLVQMVPRLRRGL